MEASRRPRWKDCALTDMLARDGQARGDPLASVGWGMVFQGIDDGMELGIKDLDAKKERYVDVKNNPSEEWALFPGSVERVLWSKLLYAYEVDEYTRRYGKIFLGGAAVEIDLEDGRKGIQLGISSPPVPSKRGAKNAHASDLAHSAFDSVDDKGPNALDDQAPDLTECVPDPTDEAPDLTECVLDPTDEAPDEALFACEMTDGRVGFFEARCGSCGYNSCSVGGAWSCFYVAKDLHTLRTLAMDDEGRRWDERSRTSNEDERLRT